MLTKALSLLLVVFLGLALGLETARFVHAHTAGGVAGASGMVNIHRALLGFSLLVTSGALLLSLHGAVVGAWLSRQWSRFTTWLELTLDGLFDFDALNVGDGTGPVVLRGDDAKRLLISLKNHASPEEMARRRQISRERLANPFVELPASVLLPCRGCSWCGVDPGDLPYELWTECDGSGRYLPSTEAERKRQLAHPKLPLRQAAPRPPPSREGKQPDGSYVIEVGPNGTHEDVVRRHPDVLFIHRESGDVLSTRAGAGSVIVRPREQ